MQPVMWEPWEKPLTAGTCNNDACIFQEERNKATFTLDRKIIAEKIRTALNEKKEQLQESVT